jgi:pimeloyl-ACP methyl ester carboxylesterase
VAGLVLINTSVGGLSPPWRRLRPAAAAQVAAAMATTDPLARERRIHALTSNRPDGAEATARRWAELAARQPVRRSNVLRQMLAAARYRAPVPMPEPPPLLVLASSADRIVDAACSRSLAYRVPGARLVEHETAGHDLPLDEPDWVVGEIARFVHEQAAEREAAAVTGTKLLQM